MDNHPIPQDVTNFQFHLIGDLTLKQFGYLIASVIIAWLMFILPIFFLVKFFFSLLFLGVGLILAFIPFEGRPSDIMFGHFLKALFVPNQYIYQAGSVPQVQITPTPQPQTKQTEEEISNTVLLQASPIPAQATPQPQPPIPPPPPMVSPTPPVQEAKPEEEAEKIIAPVVKEEATLEAALTKAKTEEATAQAGTLAAEEAHQKVQQLETQLQDLSLQKEELEKQVLALKQQLIEKTQQGAIFTPGTAVEAPKPTAHVLKIPKQLGKSIGLPLTPDVPNLLTGIVKDSRNNVLSNILIEVKDKDGNAVRAFKTNTLGQFASATPLLNGTYTISFEDTSGKQHFDTVQMEVNGDIISPIEVISVDQREKLRQELFGT